MACCGREWLLECPIGPNLDRIASELSVAVMATAHNSSAQVKTEEAKPSSDSTTPVIKEEVQTRVVRRRVSEVWYEIMSGGPVGRVSV